LHVICAAKTDVGLIRSGNEDNYLMMPERGVFVVADGMGGHAAGEIASEMAVQLISRDLGSFKGLSDGEASSRMTAAVKIALFAAFTAAVIRELASAAWAPPPPAWCCTAPTAT